MGEESMAAASTLNDVTIILLGRSGSNYLQRADGYYRSRISNVMTVSMDVAGKPTSRSTAKNWKPALIASLRAVVTPYVVLASESDFLLFDALEENIGFLNTHLQYSLSQGYVLGYRPDNGCTGFYKQGAALVKYNDAQSSLDRISRFTACGIEAWRAVVRTQVLLQVAQDLPNELAFEGAMAALSFGLLAEHSAAILPVTHGLVEYTADATIADNLDVERARLTPVVRQWDADRWQLCNTEAGSKVLEGFVRVFLSVRTAPLLFTSRWTSVSQKPQWSFESRQFVEMPYYDLGLFNSLEQLECIVHARPAGSQHIHALEGVWVRQRELMAVHLNDTPDSLRLRYQQAFSLGMFNRQVIERLIASLDAVQDTLQAQQINTWHQRLIASGAVHVEHLLEQTPSGQILEAIQCAAPDDASTARVLKHLEKHPSPQVTFLLIDLQGNDEALQRTFDSLIASGLRTFKIVVLRDGKLATITTIEDTVHFVKVSEDNLIARLNQLVGQLCTEWLMVLDAGDVLARGGLLRLHTELPGASECRAISANEIHRDVDGRLVSLVRPGTNLELLRSRPDLMSKHWLVRRQEVMNLGGYSNACPETFEFDLLLRMIERQGLAGLAHMDEYLVISDSPGDSMNAEAIETLKRHLAILGYSAQVDLVAGKTLNIDYRHYQTPQVSILLAAENDLQALKECLGRVTQRTRYQHYEVIVVADSACPEEIRSYLSRFEGNGGRIKVLWSPQVLSRAELFNQACQYASGEYLVLLSSRSHIATPAWIEWMLKQALRPEVGIVGCKMQDVDGFISHAGYDLVATTRVVSPWVGLSHTALEPALGVGSERSCQAVSSDCLMVRKSIFKQVGGLEYFERSSVAGDLDFCLKVAQAGWSTVWAPQAQVINPGVLADELARAAVVSERWPGAFTARTEVEGKYGIDVSRTVSDRQSPELTWLAALEDGQ
ncbi:O-antigen biosynthesis protein [Pseudomonas sp. IT-P258]|uniref:glycosyltransferase family 2 protein n=1 Tax=Pseudomonas sp. IT-P258 TaxID=3026447 RepID=UPI0039DFED89